MLYFLLIHTSLLKWTDVLPALAMQNLYEKREQTERERSERRGREGRGEEKRGERTPEKFMAMVSGFLLHSLEETQSSDVVRRSQPIPID